ncbi:hypothetical protein MICAK_930004 [Microcystis aeruginosa PCC 9701]|uniref:Uncharacterized protein n=1 Tax=Microcystis aeruginosa PCC 9701 TaxID=721123 RepID=I4IXU2_MICAE|nr:hypothetical protein MICAI_1980017 [Microcystis sp. T1-4]CCI39116.1 hypothetical protein MICAK_930004 [Microcystis aeruginosa PCC 9701]
MEYCQNYPEVEEKYDIAIDHPLFYNFRIYKFLAWLEQELMMRLLQEL